MGMFDKVIDAIMGRRPEAEPAVEPETTAPETRNAGFSDDPSTILTYAAFDAVHLASQKPIDPMYRFESFLPLSSHAIETVSKGVNASGVTIPEMPNTAHSVFRDEDAHAGENRRKWVADVIVDDIRRHEPDTYAVLESRAFENLATHAEILHDTGIRAEDGAMAARQIVGYAVQERMTDLENYGSLAESLDPFLGPEILQKQRGVIREEFEEVHQSFLEAEEEFLRSADRNEMSSTIDEREHEDRMFAAHEDRIHEEVRRDRAEIEADYDSPEMWRIEAPIPYTPTWDDWMEHRAGEPAILAGDSEYEESERRRFFGIKDKTFADEDHERQAAFETAPKSNPFEQTPYISDPTLQEIAKGAAHIAATGDVEFLGNWPSPLSTESRRTILRDLDAAIMQTPEGRAEAAMRGLVREIGEHFPDARRDWEDRARENAHDHPPERPMGLIMDMAAMTSVRYQLAMGGLPSGVDPYMPSERIDQAMNRAMHGHEEGLRSPDARQKGLVSELTGLMAEDVASVVVADARRAREDLGLTDAVFTGDEPERAAAHRLLWIHVPDAARLAGLEIEGGEGSASPGSKSDIARRMDADIKTMAVHLSDQPMRPETASLISVKSQTSTLDVLRDHVGVPAYGQIEQSERGAAARAARSQAMAAGRGV